MKLAMEVKRYRLLGTLRKEDVWLPGMPSRKTSSLKCRRSLGQVQVGSTGCVLLAFSPLPVLAKFRKIDRPPSSHMAR